MRKYTTLHGVRIHGFSLMHNYLNVKYRDTPWMLIAPLFGCIALPSDRSPK